MTSLQLEYQRNLETARYNKAQEQFKDRELHETHRSNVAKEKEAQRSNLAKEGETARSNRAKEELSLNDILSNLAMQSQSNAIKSMSQLETGRHNRATETEQMRSNTAREAETSRSNVAREQETHRSNVTNESIGKWNTGVKTLDSLMNTITSVARVLK